VSDPIKMTIAGGIATITLDRPEKRNALTAAMWAQLGQLVDRADRDDRVGVIIITGSGGCFTAGADIEEMPAIHAMPESSDGYLGSGPIDMRWGL